MILFKKINFRDDYDAYCWHIHWNVDNFNLYNFQQKLVYAVYLVHKKHFLEFQGLFYSYHTYLVHRENLYFLRFLSKPWFLFNITFLLLGLKFLGMGKLFIVHPGGQQIYCCKECKTPIAAKRDFIDHCKTLMDGNGLLFSASCNTKQSLESERILSTAEEDYNIVRLLSCLKCKSSMGWRWAVLFFLILVNGLVENEVFNKIRCDII